MSSSETTQILFNSPALHSLKRDQLVKLCKLHSIKASGKNTDLIQRLKNHAATLPHGSPLSVATRSEQARHDSDSQRPSEQWELLMEDIPESPEGSSRHTLRSLRNASSTIPDEFGTGGGSKSSSMSSSLRAMATSFNLKRATSNKSDDDRTPPPDVKDELASHSVPYSSIPEPSQSDLPQTDHFKFSTPDTTMEDHVPGHPPSHAPAALPQGSSTGPPKITIRLVSASNSATLSPQPGTPHLKPVDPPFDLVMGSPGAKGVPVWPLSPQPGPSERLYPALPADELDEAKRRQAMSRLPGNIAPSQAPVGPKKVYPQPSNDVQDIFSLTPNPAGKQEKVGIPRSEPFLFGSPLPQRNGSNKAFESAAASVLEEMNKRLSVAGVQKVGADVFGRIPVTASGSIPDLGNLGEQIKGDRFNKVHEEQFNKMDSIATHYAAKRGVPGSKKRKSNVLAHGTAPATKRSSAGLRISNTASYKRMGIPGGFDDEEAVDEVQEEEDRRMSKRVRVLEDDGGKDKGRRLTISPKKTEAEKKQAERERAATRKMLEVRKDKRRSSRHGGRTSLAGPQAASNKGKATPRFGFLSSAKSIVRSVWNFGVGSPAKASRPSAAATATKLKITATAAAAEAKEEIKPKPALTKKPSLAPSRPSSSLSVGGRKSIAPAARTASITAGSTSISGHQRKSSSGEGAKENGVVRRSNSRPPSLSSNNNAGGRMASSSRQSVRASSANVRSTKSACLPTSEKAAAGITAGTSGTSTDAVDERAGGDHSSGHDKKAFIFSPSGSRATAASASRLFAPTASSLAKMRGRGVSPTKTSAIVAQRAKTPPRGTAVLDAITNGPRDGGNKIFTTPLMLLPTRAVIPPPVKPTSLAAAATALASAAATRSTIGPIAERRPAASLSSPKTNTTRTTRTGQPGSTRKPRISRSRIIAKLGAQRAATTATASNGKDGDNNHNHNNDASPSASRSAVAAAGAGEGSRIPRASGSAAFRAPRVRSSIGAGMRRSYAGAKSASRGSDVLMSAKKHVRQSEYVRRRSRFASAVGAGAGMNHAVDVVDGGPYGSMAMDLDED
ncbi:hypothetical protein F5148DRAFT_141366 [Russula earlei]|uniref:Uncharacterized protein n=1 Tax=Russula earlei TaxID=71964 RepID=A0ACC0U6L9_9AGAM|nr:hypothetical protein F5148DRAFT_141366 [Russula earlei]